MYSEGASRARHGQGRNRFTPLRVTPHCGRAFDVRARNIRRFVRPRSSAARRL